MSILYRSVKNNATIGPGPHLLGRQQIYGASSASREPGYGTETRRQSGSGNGSIQRHWRFHRQAIRGGRRVGGGELFFQQEGCRSRRIRNHQRRRKGRGGTSQRREAWRRRSPVRRNQEGLRQAGH